MPATATLTNGHALPLTWHCRTCRAPIPRGPRRCEACRRPGPPPWRTLLRVAEGKACLSLEALAVLALHADPANFAARGFPRQCDTARVRNYFYGPRGLVTRGLFEWVRKGRTVRVTPAGREAAKAGNGRDSHA